MKKLFILCLAALVLVACAHRMAPGKHLFILSGQSNMFLLNPNDTFIPAVEAAFGKDQVIVVKDAKGRQTIQHWYKNWKPGPGDDPVSGDLYDLLMEKVNMAIRDETISTVTFVWMQGENDAHMKHGDVYADSLQGVIDQLRTDLNRDEVYVVIGRLSDYDLRNIHFKHWTRVREAQVQLADSRPCTAWVNTDDLNDGMDMKGHPVKNDLHYTPEGLKKLGQRFADSAIALVRHETENCD